MTLPILGEINKLITEHGWSIILKEHLSLLNTKLALLQQDIENLQQENTDLKDKCTELEQQCLRQNTSQEFVETNDMLFKRMPDGKYSNSPTCPVCKRAMWCFHAGFPYECSDDNCGHKTSVTKAEIDAIVNELNA